MLAVLLLACNTICLRVGQCYLLQTVVFSSYRQQFWSIKIYCHGGMCCCNLQREKWARQKCLYVRFPKRPKPRQAWIFKCRREDYNLAKHSRACEKHYNDSDFVLSRVFAASIGYNVNFQLQLQPDAVPSIIPRTKK